MTYAIENFPISFPRMRCSLFHFLRIALIRLFLPVTHRREESAGLPTARFSDGAGQCFISAPSLLLFSCWLHVSAGHSGAAPMALRLYAAVMYLPG